MHDVELPLYQEFYRTNHPIEAKWLYDIPTEAPR